MRSLSSWPRIVVALVAGILVPVVGCSDPSSPNVEDAIPTGKALKLQVAHDSLFFGRTLTLTVSDSADTTDIAPTYEWLSSDTSVAVVVDDGTILAVGLGSTRISVQRMGARDTLRLRVVLHRADGGVSFADGTDGSLAGIPRYCALSTAGEVYCRPRGNSGTDTTPMFTRMPGATGRKFVSVAQSLHTQCALDESGQIFCWGNNTHYIYATRAQVRTDTGPVPMATEMRFSKMTHSGHSQTCGISVDDSRAYCWGHNDTYQLGRPVLGDDSIPRPVAAIDEARDVSVSNFANCALAADGNAYCSGKVHGVGPLSGQGAQGMQPVLGDRRFTSIATGQTNVCAIDEAEAAWCWGFPTGDGTDETRPEPTAVAGGHKFQKVFVFDNLYSCGITTTSDLYCWGNFPPVAISSRLGVLALSPVHMFPGLKFRGLTGTPCGITTDNRIFCW